MVTLYIYIIITNISVKYIGNKDPKHFKLRIYKLSYACKFSNEKIIIHIQKKNSDTCQYFIFHNYKKTPYIRQLISLRRAAPLDVTLSH